MKQQDIFIIAQRLEKDIILKQSVWKDWQELPGVKFTQEELRVLVIALGYMLEHKDDVM